MARKLPFTPDDIYLLKQVSDPQLSPDGQLVAYVVSVPDREADETRMSVYLAPLDGSESARRFTHGARDHTPRWSPNGRALAFVSDRGEKSQLFVAPMDGGEARQVTHSKWGISQPAWSPDGSKVAYSSRTGEYTEAKERKAEIHLGSDPFERSFRTRRKSEAPAGDLDGLGQRGIVAEFVSLPIEFACLIEQEAPLLLRVERRDERGRFGIFRGGGAIGELQIVDPRLLSQEGRLVSARVEPQGTGGLAATR